MDQRLLIVGINHRGAPVAVRERLAYAPDEITAALERLKAAAPALGEAALISTCNRVELIGVSSEPASAADSSIDFLAADRAIDASEFAPAIYRLEGRDAARHLFRVGASLDSMVVGEPQILGQLKLAYAQAAAAGSAGLILHRAFHKAFSVAKRVRKATLIGRGAVSVSSAAVALAGRIFDTLSDKTVLLMGAGRTAELTARHLRGRGVRSLVVTSRTLDHASRLAENLGATTVPFDAIVHQLELADIVIGSLTVSAPVLGPAEFEPVARARHYRPLFLIDLGVPRNFDERLNALENVYLYDIDDLGAVATENRDERAREAGRAEVIVEVELESFMRWLDELGLVPAIKDIRLSIEELRDYELRRHRGWLASLEPVEQERVESLTRGLANKLFHRILRGLRQNNDGAGPDSLYTAELARRLLRAPSTGDPDEIADPETDPFDDFDSDDGDAGKNEERTRQHPMGMGLMRLRIGARPSALALAQAAIVAEAIRASLPGVAIEIVRIRTTGDKLKTAALASVGGKGLFIRELENALGERQIDIAVHSMKDLPAVLDARFRIAAVPSREDPRDAIVSRIGGGLDGLPAGARVGTASMRRHFQALGVRPDLLIAALRGNVDTRLNKLAAGEFDAIIVALAGLRRIGRADTAGLSVLDEHDFVPAGGQGALAIEVLAEHPAGGSAAVEDALGALNDRAARCETTAERAFLATIGASCVSPVGVHARLSSDRLVMDALLFDLAGRNRITDKLEVALEDCSEVAASAIGEELGNRMLARGAAEMVALSVDEK